MKLNLLAQINLKLRMSLPMSSPIRYLLPCILFDLEDENVHWNLNFATSLMGNSQNFNSSYDKIFKKLSMMAHTNEFRKCKKSP